ncbi:TPA: hypothetical protein N0F65_009140, partial [Lagenidium giganteum]
SAGQHTLCDRGTNSVGVGVGVVVELQRSTLALTPQLACSRSGASCSSPARSFVRSLAPTDPPSSTMNLKQYMFTKDDAFVAFNLFCGVCGIGTLGMPANFARAGPYLGVFAMIFMGFTNVYASVLVSKTMLIAPRSVKTFGDLGEWCLGPFGRYAVVISQMGVCLLAPCAFLVLGGNMLHAIFPGAFEITTWIILMALMVLPVCLVPTLKEGAGAALAGCLGTLVADIIGIGMLFHGMKGHPAVPAPEVSIPQVASTFGNLALAYGAAVVIPALQRQHSQPERMPQVVGITIAVITVIFIILAWTGYASVGCQISGNLLFNIMPDPVTKLSSLGMKADFGAAVLAYLAMQVHLMVAFAVLLHPAFYIAERMVLGMHKVTYVDETLPYVAQDTPIESIKRSSSAVSMTKQEAVAQDADEEHDENAEYKGAATTIKYVLLRLAIVAALVVTAVVLKDKFIDLTDFIGSSAITTCCIVLPIIFYMRRMGKKMPIAERVVCVFIVVVCGALGVYVTYKTGKAIFAPGAVDPDAPKFPFCKPEHQKELLGVILRFACLPSTRGRRRPLPASTPTMGLKQRLLHYMFTRDDAIAAFNLFCGVCGVGTLGMPANFARAGPYLGILAMIFMGFTNVYATVIVSKTMLIAPRTVKTFGDLGEWCMGSFGRYAVVISQMGVCLMAPCAMLVLGGNLLFAVFPSAFEMQTWIILMALMVLPVCLVPTLKEGAGAAFAGCLGTIVADTIGIGMLHYGLKGHPAVPKPAISLAQVASTFGNLALAYGAAVVIPALQRRHNQPERMPQVVGITMIIITIIFMILAGTGYASVGCQISGNLLFSIMPDPVTKLSSLGMKADFGAAVLAYLAMQLHITIAFAVMLHPAFYIAERLVLGMHKSTFEDETLPYAAHDTPGNDNKRPSSIVSATKEDVNTQEQHDEENDLADYKGTTVVIKYVTLRLAIIIVLVIVAVALKNKFIELADFIGASANTTSCILLPIIFYLKRMGNKIPMVERVVAVFIVIVCTILGSYVTYTTGKAMFAPGPVDPNAPNFPFCKPEHQKELYYIKP